MKVLLMQNFQTAATVLTHRLPYSAKPHARILPQRGIRMREYKLTEIPHLRVLGRTNGSLTPLTLFWNASGLELNVKGSECWVDIDADFDTFEPWVDVLINHARTQRLMLTPGHHRLCLFRGLDPGRVRNVMILRDTQPMKDDRRMLLQITGVETDGTFEPLQDYAMKIEFLGDSITTGEGMCGAYSDMDWTGQCMDSVNNYTFFTAQALNAEYHVFSQSGWGVHCSWDNNPDLAIPRYYETLCGFLDRENYAGYGAQDRWDFASWQPDVVVVNLGTNDQGAFGTPPYVDPVTGRQYKMHRNEYGLFEPADRKLFEKDVLAFLHMLRRDNPGAYLIWAYGMLGGADASATLYPEITDAVAQFVAETGDQRVEALELANTAPGEYGSRMHPGKPAHRHAAEILVKRIREISQSPVQR